MPLIVYLKETDKAVIVKGDGEDLRKEILPQFEKKSCFLFETIDKIAVLVAKDSISRIEEISEKELMRRKAEYEKQMKQQQQRNGQIVMPSFKIPSRN